MLTSQNGWKANDKTLIRTYPVPGTAPAVKLSMRQGDVSVVLRWAAHRWDADVEPLEGPIRDDWGYAPRNVRGSSTVLSNHASGTAIDCNATQHPRGVAIKRTFTPGQIAGVRAIVRDSAGVMRWGGDYVTAPTDGMHLEINRGSAAVKRLANKIRAGKVPGSWVGFPGPRPATPTEGAMTTKQLHSSTSQSLENGVEVDVLWDTEAGLRPTVQAVAGQTSVTANLQLDNVPAGAEYHLRLVEVEPTAPYAFKRTLGGIHEGAGNAGQTFVDFERAAVTTSKDRLRLRLKVFADGVTLLNRQIEVHTQEA